MFILLIKLDESVHKLCLSLSIKCIHYLNQNTQNAGQKTENYYLVKLQSLESCFVDCDTLIDWQYTILSLELIASKKQNLT